MGAMFAVALEVSMPESLHLRHLTLLFLTVDAVAWKKARRFVTWPGFLSVL
jgi:hypothetical protein